MPRAGRHAELAVEALKRLLYDDPYPLIQSPGYLKDLVTGQQREFDVMVTEKSGVETLEVRDRSAVVGVDEIEAFVTKVGDTKADKAAFISTRGFGGPALKKANYYGIACFRLQRSNTNHWGNSPKVDVCIARPASDGKSRVAYFIGDASKQETDHEYQIMTELGEPVDVSGIINSALAVINSENGRRRLTRSGRAKATVPLKGGKLVARCQDSDAVQAVTSIIVDIELDVTVESFKPVVYGLYSTEDEGSLPVAEMVVYPELTKVLGLNGGAIGIGTRPGGPLKMLMMREPEE